MIHDHGRKEHVRHDEAGAKALPAGVSVNRLAFTATVHCLSGCAVGEVLGLVIGTALEWSPAPAIALAVGLAFVFGYAFTMIPLLKSGLAFRAVLRLAFAADTVSIAIMELVDNAIMIYIPGAMQAGVDSRLFWISLVIALAIAGAVAFPVNRWLITLGKGHAVIHEQHHRH